MIENGASAPSHEPLLQTQGPVLQSDSLDRDVRS